MEIIKKQIYLDSLKREANLYVLLPEGYEKSNLHYPVLYFHDGQNLFYKEDSYMGETWGVAQTLQQKEFPKVIVVALSCAVTGNVRLQEYNVFDSKFPSHPTWHVKGKGNIYLEYLFNHLKPLIDRTYRTMPTKEHTYMLGSSMGGVISLQAAFLYPDVVGHVAGLSNAFYASMMEIEAMIKNQPLSLLSLYLDTGDREVGLEQKHTYLEANHTIKQLITRYHPHIPFHFQIIEGGIHNEVAWRLRLPDVLRYLFRI